MAAINLRYTYLETHVCLLARGDVLSWWWNLYNRDVFVMSLFKIKIKVRLSLFERYLPLGIAEF